jgi:phosphatidylglycerol lysyltransferase
MDDLQLPASAPPGDAAAAPHRIIGPRLRPFVLPAIGIGICIVLLLLLERATAGLDYHAVIRSLTHLPTRAISLALLATALSYLGMVGRDWLALRQLGARVRPATLFVGGIASAALGNAAGFGALTGGAVRYRVYGADGVGVAAVTRVSVLVAATFGLALVGFGGLGTLLAAAPMAALSGLPERGLQIVGAAGVVATLAAVVLCGRNGRTLHWRLPRWRSLQLDLPGRGFLLGQIGFIAVDVLGAGLALWVLLPASGVAFGTYLAVYCAALLLGVIGHTPGGLGVFEAALLFILGAAVPPNQAVAALLAYRAVYFAAPVVVAAALLAAFEAHGVLPRLEAVGRRAAPHIVRLTPLLLGPVFVTIVAFGVGAMLVLSGATPAFGHRLAILEQVIPLWVLESANLLGSVLGVFMLFAARGLLRRLDGAWWLATALTLASLVLALAKGLAFFEVGVLSAFLLLLLATRPSFNRPASLFDLEFSPAWLAAVAAVLLFAGWVFLFAFRKVPYSNDLFWQFAFDDKAPRALRATFAAGLIASVIGLWQMLRPAAGRVAPPSSTDLADAARIVRAQERSDAMLAMMGDKSFLFSPDRRAFLMYAKRGRSWVALYDPVGPREAWPGLIAELVRLAHAHDGRAAFYQVRPDSLPLYLEAGLRLIKLGEEARIDLHDFGLDGSKRTHLRYALKRGAREGLTAEVFGPDDFPTVFPLLRGISDAWLQHRRAREKSFSVAAFEPAWLAPQSVMLVRQHGVPVAFVSFMTTDVLAEATVGVMRHLETASPYTMDFLFTRLALHLKEAGYARFSLGMAPLAGVAATPLASSWHQLSVLLWRYGGRIYNFAGLRSFKSKFGPVWEPRYLAASGTLGPLLSLADIARLCSAGEP